VGVGLWTFTRMCSITQTDAIALFTSTLRASWAAPDGDILASFCVLYFQRAACSKFQTCVWNSH